MLLLIIILLYYAIGIHTQTLCHNEQDCRALDSFCGGEFICNYQQSRCVAKRTSYDACSALRAQAKSFYQSSGLMVSFLCVERLRECIEVYYCLSDGDCDDSLFCNGLERCEQGRCVSVPNSVPLCKDCDERTRCGILSLEQELTTPPGTTTDPTGTYVILLVFTLLIMLAVCFILINVCRSTNEVITYPSFYS
jgi:hypothetical protein